MNKQQQLAFERRMAGQINAAEAKAAAMLENLYAILEQEEKATELYGPAVEGVVGNINDAVECVNKTIAALRTAHAGMGDVSANFGGK